jgi:hypothetical protein
MAEIIGEAASALSRMRSTDFAGASEARVLDRADPLAKLARMANCEFRHPGYLYRRDSDGGGYFGP